MPPTFGRVPITLGIGPYSSYYLTGQAIIFLWCGFFLLPPYVIGQAIYIFILWFLLPFFSSPNLSGRRLDVYHTSTHGVALV